MDLSIIIVNYRAPSMLRASLESLLAAWPRSATEVIVVDNASGDRSVTMLKEYFLENGRIRLIESTLNRGYAGGANLGFREARGRYLFLMNPDILVLDDSLDRLVAFMDSHPRVGLLAPRLLNPNGSVQQTTFRFPSFGIAAYRRTPLGALPHARKRLREYLMLDEPIVRPLPVDWVLGAAMLVRREALAQVGFMDERYFLYVEDLDWCRSFWEKGLEVWYDPEATLVHLHARASARTPWFSGLRSPLTRWHIASWVKYFSKWRSKPLPR